MKKKSMTEPGQPQPSWETVSNAFQIYGLVKKSTLPLLVEWAVIITSCFASSLMTQPIVPSKQYRERHE